MNNGKSSITFALLTTANINKKHNTHNPIMVGNSIIASKRIYAGINCKGAEFLKTEDRNLICIHDKQIYFWPNFPKNIIDIIEEDMMKYPTALACLAKWQNLLPEDYIRQYISCRFGGLDDQPDITPDGKVLHAEYVSCRLRGTCEFEGRLCLSLKADNGIITPAEIEVLKRSDLPIKIIAGRLFVTEETVKSHLKSIKEKTGMQDKLQVAVYAHKKGLINT